MKRKNEHWRLFMYAYNKTSVEECSLTTTLYRNVLFILIVCRWIGLKLEYQQGYNTINAYVKWYVRIYVIKNMNVEIPFQNSRNNIFTTKCVIFRLNKRYFQLFNLYSEKWKNETNDVFIIKWLQCILLCLMLALTHIVVLRLGLINARCQAMFSHLIL